MARNQEKAQSMMNRYLKGKQEEASGPRKLRPFLASECTDLHDADRWHHQIIREISRKVSEIQNAGLGEHRCATHQHFNVIGSSKRAHMIMEQEPHALPMTTPHVRSFLMLCSCASVPIDVDCSLWPQRTSSCATAPFDPT